MHRVLPRRSPLDRDIARLAVPALGALVAEPLFLLTDTALVGHLGADALGGLGIASTVLQTVVGLLIFLAYATTPAVARALGSGNRAGAIRAGIDGMWLALLLGVLLLVVGLPLAGPLVAAFGSTPEVTAAGTTYLSISLWGMPGMLLVIAATGLLRGLQDTRTPLVIAVAGFAANAALNAVFIYGFGWGIAGSAAGTVVAQWSMAAVYVVMAIRAARATGASLSPGLRGVTGAAASGGWLLVRTASLRAAMLSTVVVGTSLGVSSLAALQIALTIFSTIAFMLDALAIAGQSMIGHGLGASQEQRVKAITRRLVELGIVLGAAIGVVLVPLAWLLGPVFTGDPEVTAQLTPTVLVMALGIPLAGFVFVLDGVLIGAGDARYLAVAGLVALAIYLPMLWTVSSLGAGLPWLWLAFGIGYIGARGLTLGLRARGDTWIVTGA
ncbi:putative MATE family efflux protein [Glaciihabitans tibetensis]|uniref:Putative MATE family efflux protein n=1 Tax=Glaciihabitans tibetensis TaxID=1266600 RepID=A0A2T0VCK4_9MICO|nr:MATE family efflux transporter [Glaciihabitans tibetensis]PRY67908.1 putative MATE family efflux protein [Glaciihabitans tibetensis]